MRCGVSTLCFYARSINALFNCFFPLYIRLNWSVIYMLKSLYMLKSMSDFINGICPFHLRFITYWHT